MNGPLSSRLTRLERTVDIGNPFAGLSEDELDARLHDVTTRLEAKLGMPLREYARKLLRAIEADEALPDDWEPTEARRFASLVISNVH